MEVRDYPPTTIRGCQPGVRVGRWTIIGPGIAPAHIYGKPRAYVLCKCDCGTEKSILRESLKVSRSCGCFKAERASEFHTTHGSRTHPFYGAWYAMLQRCTNPNNESYHNYGGRGIQVCPEWHSFAGFLEWAKSRWAPGLTIDRINNSGNYEPSNCRFITRKEQNRNTRWNVRVTFQGREITMAELSEVSGVRYGKLRDRLRRRGWSVEEAIHAG